MRGKPLMREHRECVPGRVIISAKALSVREPDMFEEEKACRALWGRVSER